MTTIHTTALSTARALLQQRMSWDESDHDRAVRRLDAFMCNLQKSDPVMADAIRRVLYEDVTGMPTQQIEDEIMPEILPWERD